MNAKIATPIARDYPVGFRSPCLGFRTQVLALLLQFILCVPLFAQRSDDNLRFQRFGNLGDHRLVFANKAILANGLGFRSIDLVTGKKTSISFGDVPPERDVYASELDDDGLLFVLMDRKHRDQHILIKVSSLGAIQSYKLPLTSSHQYGGMIAKRYAIFGDEDAYVAIDCLDMTEGANKERSHVFSRAELKSGQTRRLACFQTIPGSSAIVEVSQGDNRRGVASVIDFNIVENTIHVTASWDVTYANTDRLLSVNRDGDDGTILIWTFATNAPSIECHTIQGELVKSHKLPDIDMRGCTWGPNYWCVEENGKTLTGIHLRDRCEWNFDIATEMDLHLTVRGNRLIGRFQGSVRNFLVLETYKDKVKQLSVLDESTREEQFKFVYSQRVSLGLFDAPSGNVMLCGSFDYPIAIEVDRNSGRILEIFDSR